MKKLNLYNYKRFEEVELDKELNLFIGDNESVNSNRITITTNMAQKISMENQLRKKFENTLNIYPNPLNPTSKIRYSLTEKSKIKVCVHDLLGREIININKGFEESGEHETFLDLCELSSGIYIVTLIILNSSNYVQLNKKAIFLK